MNVITRLVGSRFTKNVSTLIAGNLAAQFISVLTLPVLTRLFTASDFGAFATVTSVIAIIGSISSLRYELAIPLPFSDKKAFNIFVISFITLIIISTLLFCLISIIFTLRVAEQFLEPISLIWFVFFGVILFGANNILTYSVIRGGDASILAKVLFLSELIKFPIQIVMFKQGAFGLLMASLIGTLFSVVFLTKISVGDKTSCYRSVTRNSIKKIALEYSKFPKYSTLVGLVNIAGQHLPNVLIMYLYGPAEAGFFFFANKILNVLNSVSGVAIRQSFLIEAIEKDRKDNLYSEVKRAVRVLVVILVLPALTVIAIGEEIIVFIFGASWEVSGEIIPVVMLIIASQFITSPVSQVFAIKDKIKESLVLHIILTTFKLTGIMVGYSVFNSFFVSVSLYSILGAIGYLMFLNKVFYYSKIND